MRIQHNIMAMNAYRNYNTNTKALSGNLEKLSSGYKINRAGDDAAGLAISEKMRAQITGLDAAQKNVKDGISLVKTAEGAMQEIQDMLNRMDYLATQSANGTYQDEVDRENLQKEVNNLKTEINRIADSANFNGIKLLDGSQAATGADTNSKFKGWDSIKGSLAAGLDDVKATATTSQINLPKLKDQTTDVKNGDTLNITIGMSDGTTYDLTATVKFNEAGDKYTWVDEDGNELTAEASTTGAKHTDTIVYGQALKGLVENSELGKTFTAEVDTTNFNLTLTAKEKGAGPATVTSVDMSATTNGTRLLAADTAVYGRAAVDTANTTAGEDAYQALDLSQAKVFDHAADKTALDKAVFEINGEKFVFIEKDKVTDENIKKMKEAGIEHWVETSTTGVAGSGPSDADVAKMVEKIKFTTGLDVKQGDVDTNGVWTDADLTNLNGETHIKISDGTSSKKGGGLTLQIGDTSDKFNQMQVQIGDMHVNAMGTGKTNLDGQEVKVTKTIADIDIGTQGGAQEAIAVIKNAINYVSSIRGDLGAVQNRLEHTQNNLGVMAENIQDAESTIRDTDVANEMMSYVKNNILVQSAQAMLAQANQVPQGVLQLLG